LAKYVETFNHLEEGNCGTDFSDLSPLLSDIQESDILPQKFENCKSKSVKLQNWTKLESDSLTGATATVYFTPATVTEKRPFHSIDTCGRIVFEMESNRGLVDDEPAADHASTVRNRHLKLKIKIVALFKKWNCNRTSCLE
jgi:hypothetical protein